jgi:DNA-binding transcriptional LysR family regulator
MRKRMGRDKLLDWDDLRSFLAIARAGSLSGAARALGVRQSTMSRRLEALERANGARLFEKTPRGFVLTQTGEAILGRVEQIETEAIAVERTITGKDIRLEGVVRLTTVETLASEILPPILAGFHQRYPGIMVEVIADSRSLSLTRREADIALRFGRLPQSDLAVRKVGDLTSGVFASVDYLARAGQPNFSLGAPGHHCLLLPEEFMAMPEMAWFAGITAKATPSLRSNSRHGLLAACRAGMGLVLLERYLADPCPDLVLLTTPSLPPPREIWLAVHNDLRHTPRVRALTECLTTELRASAARLNPEQGGGFIR